MCGFLLVIVAVGDCVFVMVMVCVGLLMASVCLDLFLCCDDGVESRWTIAFGLLF